MQRKQEQQLSTAADRLNNGTKVMTIQEWFDKRLARYESRGNSHTEALDETYEDLDVAERFSNAEKDAFYQERQEEYKGYVMRYSIACRDTYVTSAAIKYHEVGKPFKVKFKDVTRKMVAVEANGCYGCAFAKVVGRAPAGYPLYGCRCESAGTHAVCKARYVSPLGVELDMREDGKNVVFKYVKQ